MALGQQVAEKEERLRAEKERDQQLGTRNFRALRHRPICFVSCDLV